MDTEANNRISYKIIQSSSRKSLKFIVQLQKCAANDHKEPKPLKTLTWTEVELCSRQGKSWDPKRLTKIWKNINIYKYYCFYFTYNRLQKVLMYEAAPERSNWDNELFCFSNFCSNSVFLNCDLQQLCLDGGRGGCGWRSLAGRKAPRSLHKAPFKSWMHWLEESFWLGYIDRKLVDVWREYDKNTLCFQAIRF